MAINLVKGQTIDLRKNDKGESFDLSSVTIGLGWDVKQKNGGFLGKLFGSGEEEEYDLDAIAFLLNAEGKIANMGRTVQKGNHNISMFEGDVVYFNSMQHPSGNIWLTGDNRTGAGDGDDEQIIVKLNNLSPAYDRILFVVAIYQGKKNHQHFGMVENAFIRAVDRTGKEIARYSLSGDATFNGICSMTFAEVYRKDGSWKFRAIGEPHSTDSFVDILQNYR
ncbi:TerD family protein [Mucilaginibacter gotjawali]|uniref:Stress response protein SCP2 n=2 Tax=Mucilaginibacter gotjawali TaxID=1550579 RepID=A0A839SFT4_9SPHI|nr:TerD family protein [Mucilaginibacter gotjawali]MBB3056163.1 stress response protein SCP2 [Mucilaginibacter gotjawali]BAU53496.1 Stress response protein SCP2 [Mucilaginibacter gotjawali]